MLARIASGRPTKGQTDKLVDRIKMMADGDSITHEEICDVIGERMGHRYRTILFLARRRILDEVGCVLISNKGEGYTRACGYDQVKTGISSISSGVRRIGKGVKVVAAVADDRLASDGQRKARDFVVQRAKYLAEIAKTNRKEISLVVGKPEFLPK